MTSQQSRSPWLAVVQSRYADLLAAVPTSDDGCTVAEAAAFTIGRPNCDAVTLAAALAMWAEADGTRTFIARLTVDGSPVELDPAPARDAAADLRRLAAELDTLAAAAEALTAAEAAAIDAANERYLAAYCDGLRDYPRIAAGVAKWRATEQQV